MQRGFTRPGSDVAGGTEVSERNCEEEEHHRTGQPLAASLVDYGVPRADSVPAFRSEIAQVLSPTNPLGIKAGGEGGTTAAPAVIVSAIVDALREYGVRHITMPATPYAVWQTIQDAVAATREDQ